MHYNLFHWWDILASGRTENYKPDPKIVNLNPYQKPIFQERDGNITINVETSL